MPASTTMRPRCRRSLQRKTSKPWDAYWPGGEPPFQFWRNFDVRPATPHPSEWARATAPRLLGWGRLSVCPPLEDPFVDAARMLVAARCDHVSGRDVGPRGRLSLHRPQHGPCDVIPWAEWRFRLALDRRSFSPVGPRTRCRQGVDLVGGRAVARVPDAADAAANVDRIQDCFVGPTGYRSHQCGSSGRGSPRPPRDGPPPSQ